jgi:hypothetical protein
VRNRPASPRPPATRRAPQALQQPGAQELAREVSGSLGRRFLARAIKFGFGIPEAQRAAAAPAAVAGAARFI